MANKEAQKNYRKPLNLNQGAVKNRVYARLFLFFISIFPLRLSTEKGGYYRKTNIIFLSRLAVAALRIFYPSMVRVCFVIW